MVRMKVCFDRTLRLASRIGTVLVVLLMGSSALQCVYFNTFYNARKFFNEAEKKRQTGEKPRGDEGTRRLGGKGAARSYEQLYDRAIEKASMVLQFHPDSKWVDDSLFLLGKAFYWKGEYPKAIRKFEELEVNCPDSPFLEEAQYWHGLSLWKMKEFEAASGLLVKLSDREDFEWADDALFALGEMAFEREEYTDATERYDALLSRFKKSDLRAESRRRMGEANMAMGRYEPARDDFEGALREKPEVKTEYICRLNIGECLEALDRFEEALGIYKRLLKNDKFRAYESEIRLKIAGCHIDLERKDAALDEYERIAEQFPKTEAAAEALYHMGGIYLKDRNDLDRAKELFDRSIQERSGTDVAKLSRDRRADLVSLEKYREEFAKGDSGAAYTGLLLAELYLFRLEQPDSALAMYERILRYAPDDTLAPKAAYSIAWIKGEIFGDSVAASSGFERVLADYPKTRYAKMAAEILGIVQEEEDPAERAFLDAERARLNGAESEEYLPQFERIAAADSMSPYAPKALYMAAWTYENVAGDSALAVERYQALIDRFPNTEFARVAAQKLETREAEQLSSVQSDSASGIPEAEQFSSAQPDSASVDSGIPEEVGPFQEPAASSVTEPEGTGSDDPKSDTLPEPSRKRRRPETDF